MCDCTIASQFHTNPPRVVGWFELIYSAHLDKYFLDDLKKLEYYYLLNGILTWRSPDSWGGVGTSFWAVDWTCICQVASLQDTVASPSGRDTRPVPLRPPTPPRSSQLLLDSAALSEDRGLLDCVSVRQSPMAAWMWAAP